MIVLRVADDRTTSGSRSGSTPSPAPVSSWRDPAGRHAAGEGAVGRGPGL